MTIISESDYGTPEFYSELFADILADVQHDRPGTGEAILQGFVMAVNDWAEYHKQQNLAYEELLDNILQR